MAIQEATLYRQVDAEPVTLQRSRVATVTLVQNRGPAGPPSPGPAGSPGLNGKTIRNGNGAPSNLLGVDDDYYIDNAAHVIYGPKAGGAWPAGVALIGASDYTQLSNRPDLTVYAPKASPQFTDGGTGVSATFGDGTGQPIARFFAGAGKANLISCFVGGVARWVMLPGNGAAETGGNAGSDFGLYRYNDAGAYLGSPLVISRATGVAAFEASPTAPTPPSADNSNSLATTAFVKSQSGSAARVLTSNLASVSIPATVTAFASDGYYSTADGGQCLFKVAAVQSAGLGRRQTGDGRWWEVAGDGGEFRPEMYGARGDCPAWQFNQATFTGVTNDAPSIQEMFDHVNPGSFCVFSNKGYYVSPPGGTGHCLTLNKVLRLEGRGSFTISGGNVLSFGACLRWDNQITAASDIIHFIPPTGGESHGFVFRGINGIPSNYNGAFNFSDPAAVYYGRDFLHINTTVGIQALYKPCIEWCYIWASGGYAVFHENASNLNADGGFITGLIQYNTLYNGIKALETGDSNNVLYNRITGKGWSVDWQTCVAQANTTVILGNNLTSRSGILLLRRGTRTHFWFNNCEAQYIRAGGSGHMVDLQFTAGGGTGVSIKHNYIAVVSAAPGVRESWNGLIRINSVSGELITLTHIEDNQLSCPPGGGVIVGLTLGGTAKQTIIGPNGWSSALNVLIDDQYGAIQTIGQAREPVLSSGWVQPASGSERLTIKRDLSGEVRIEGKIVGGTTAAATTVITAANNPWLPAGVAYGIGIKSDGTPCSLSVDVDGTVRAFTPLDATWTYVSVRYTGQDLNLISQGVY